MNRGVAIVSLPSALAPRETNETAQSSHAVVNPVRNPSYPQREHFTERKPLEEKLREWDEKIAAIGRKLAAMGSHPNRDTYGRLYHQMQGARDQMAEAVRRLPLETGTLYEEDRERLAIAEAALSRVMQRWEAAG
jgi:hypothetical protein